MSLRYALEHEVHKMHERNWDKIYILVDIHGTIFESSYSISDPLITYPDAINCLRLMSSIKEFCLILWSSTSKSVAENYLKYFADNGINFKYFNENPEVENNNISIFDKKFYFNVGIDDKFGFEANQDWWHLMNAINSLIDENLIHKE